MLDDSIVISGGGGRNLAPNYRAVSEAARIRRQAGVPSHETVGPRAGTAPGLSDAAALSATQRTTITSETDASGLASSGTGTEADPYVIRDLDLDNSEASGSNGGLVWSDPDATYYCRFVNCRVTGYNAHQIRIDTGTKAEIINCQTWDPTAYGIDVQGGEAVIRELDFAGFGGDDAVRTGANGVTVTVEDSAFTANKRAWSDNANAYGVQGFNDNATMTVRYCEATAPGLAALYKPWGDCSVTLTNNLVSGSGALFKVSGSMSRSTNGVTVKYCRTENNSTGAQFYAYSLSNVEVAYCEFADAPDGARILHFTAESWNDGNGRPTNVRDSRVHHCKFTDSLGTGGAGNEVCESFPAGERVEFDHNWTTECSEDAFEHAYPYTECEIHHCVADNAGGQIVDYFGAFDPDSGTATGLDINAECHHIYGSNCRDAVLITDSDGVDVWHVFAEVSNASLGVVTLEQRNGTAGQTPRDCTVVGPLASADSAPQGSFATKGDVGPNNVAIWADSEGNIQTYGDVPAEWTEVH